MPKTNEIKKGIVLNYNSNLLIVKDIDIQLSIPRGATTLYKMRFSDVRTGLKVEERFKGDDIIDTAKAVVALTFLMSMVTNICSWIKKTIRRIPLLKIRLEKNCCLCLKAECRICRLCSETAN